MKAAAISETAAVAVAVTAVADAVTVAAVAVAVAHPPAPYVQSRAHQGAPPLSRRVGYNNAIVATAPAAVGHVYQPQDF